MNKSGNLRRKQNCQRAAYQSQRTVAKTLALALTIQQQLALLFCTYCLNHLSGNIELTFPDVNHFG